MSEVVNAIDAYLATLKEKVVQETQAAADHVSLKLINEADAIRHALSGAFGEAIEVCLGADEDEGSFFAEIPVAHLKTSGLKLVETFRLRDEAASLQEKMRVIIGTPDAEFNASNRVAKPLGEGYKVVLDSSNANLVYFRITKV
jgi:hypothetical protein